MTQDPSHEPAQAPAHEPQVRQIVLYGYPDQGPFATRDATGKVTWTAELTDPTPAELTWEELAALFELHHECPCGTTGVPCVGKNCLYKVGAAWSPVVIEGKRLNDNVRAITFAVLDFDHLSPDDAASVGQKLEGFRSIAYTTHNHRPEDLCFRVVLELSRPLSPDEWRAFLATLVAHHELPCDPTCKDVSRLYFMPSCSKGAEHWTVVSEGATIDVEPYLRMPTPQVYRPSLVPQAPVSSASPAPVIPIAVPIAVDLEELRLHLLSHKRKKQKSADPEDKARAACLKRIQHGEALAVAGDHKGRTHLPRGRNTELHRAAWVMAYAMPVGTPGEAAWALLGPSLDKMDLTTDPEDWEEGFLSAYEKAVDKRAADEAAFEEQRIRDLATKNKLVAMVHERFAPKPPAPFDGAVTADRDGGDGEDDADQDEDPLAWAADILWRTDAKPPVPKGCGSNVHLILMHAPETKGFIRFNSLSKRIEVSGGLFEHVPQEVLSTKVMNWLNTMWQIEMKLHEVEIQLVLVAYENQFDPLVDYLSSLEWDGMPRVRRLFADFIPCATVDQDGTDITSYVEQIGFDFCVGAVARGLCTGKGRDGLMGQQVDVVPVLEGLEGLRKTSALRILGGDFFVETQLVLGEKDSKQMTIQYWIVELSELSSFKKSEGNALKSFLSIRTESFRAPYAKCYADAARRAVFIATTNEDQYLLPAHGKRRFFPLRVVERVDVAKLKHERDQIWAEAVQLYRSGAQWWIDDDNVPAKTMATSQAEGRMESSALEAKILGWWLMLTPKQRPEAMTSYDVMNEILKVPSDRLGQSRALQMEIGDVLRTLGFTRVRKQHGGQRIWAYEPNESLKTAPQRKSAVMQMVQRSKARQDEAA